MMSDGKVKAVHFDHLKFWVGNAKQAATWYCVHMGFEPYAYRGLETGSRKVVSHVVKQKQMLLVFESALLPGNQEMGSHLVQHGDGVKDVAFQVEDLEVIVQKAKERGAALLRDVWEESDEHGSTKFATIQPFGDTVHTFVQRSQYNGLFLPGYKSSPLAESLNRLLKKLPDPEMDFIDHCVGNQPDMEMENVVQWYEKILSFHRFWACKIQTQSANHHTCVVTDESETVMLPILEPAKGKGVSQMQEFVDYYGGPGIQHIAICTNDIIKSISTMKERGMEFLQVPDAYYDSLRERLKSAKISVLEDIDTLQQLKILVDYDDNGYLLQIFTRPVEDRPTLFIEIIQRHNHRGFGAGNVKALFESVEKEQELRGNLFYDFIHNAPRDAQKA